MSQSNTLCIGLDGYKDTMVVTYVAQDHGAAVTSLGIMGTRQGDLDPHLRQIPAKANYLLFVYAEGPCGPWPQRCPYYYPPTGCPPSIAFRVFGPRRHPEVARCRGYLTGKG